VIFVIRKFKKGNLIDRWENQHNQEANALIRNEHQCESSVIIDMTTKFMVPECCCIYKVPDPLRKLNEEVYNPQVISIGPFHHGKKKNVL
jgi:hypothetical protein